ncbi:MAG: hypothetical protein HOG19_16285 [Gammaproteobacteria bacterium]|jgi:hypothetical protein|nr:hypothetical protein [Gammaproteobacteria bacterium]
MTSNKFRFSYSGLNSGLIFALLMISSVGFSQDDDAVDLRPAPRGEDGHVSFEPPSGEGGTWVRRQGNLVINPGSYEAARTAGAPIHIDDIPIQPWAKALTNYRHDIFLASEPYTRCKPASGPRSIMSPYGLEIVSVPDLQRMYIFNISNAMSYRIIYMDGREHPEDLRPSYSGHSVGHWEGDTLVVDTIGMNEKSWMSRDGLPSTDQLHLIERFTRPSLDTAHYEVTIDDPGAYTAPWTSSFVMGWQEGDEMFEYVCQENNLSPESMLGDGRLSRITP